MLAQGQERLVLDDLPAAAGAAHLRPDAVRAGRQRATASRASAASRTATTSTRAPPTWPISTTHDSYWSGYRRFFVGAFPGLVLGFFAVPDGPGARSSAGWRSTSRSASRASRVARHVREDARTHTLTTLFGAIAFAIFYWYAADDRPRAADLGDPRRGDRARRRLVRAHRPQGEAVPGARDRAARRPRRVARGVAPRSPVRAGGGTARAPEVTFVPDEQARRAEAGPVAAGDRRGQRPADRGRLPDGRLRRRPGGDQGGHGLHVADLRRRARDARPARATPRTRAWPAACASPARSRSP